MAVCASFVFITAIFTPPRRQYMHDGIVDMFNFSERNSQLKNAKHILVITVVCK